VRELLKALAARDDDARYLLYARRRWAEVELDERFRWRLIAAADPWWHVLSARAANRECDAYLSTNSYLTVWFLRIPAAPIVHDLIAFEPEMRPNARSTVIERVTIGPAVRRSAAFICTTKATADALLDRFPVAANRTLVAPLGVELTPAGDLDAQQTAALPPSGFVLAVGTLEPRKNLPRLVEAYSRLDERVQRRHPLVVVGALGWRTGETLDALRRLGERCVMLGYVSDAALAELYRRCAVFCYPSLGEGFGLPVLEAMAAGAAVVTSNLSSLPEVGGETVEYVDPRDAGSIANGLERLLRSPERRAELGELAKARALSFSWSRFAAQLVETLQGVAT
jgi:glycosyltransferase involved in cell wall biosynthesis